MTFKTCSDLCWKRTSQYAMQWYSCLIVKIIQSSLWFLPVPTSHPQPFKGIIIPVNMLSDQRHIVLTSVRHIWSFISLTAPARLNTNPLFVNTPLSSIQSCCPRTNNWNHFSVPVGQDFHWITGVTKVRSDKNIKYRPKWQIYSKDLKNLNTAIIIET